MRVCPAINMREQRAINEKNGLVTNRKHALDDLYLQLKHYRPQDRRDAVLGLKELMTKYPPLAMLRLNDFLERVLPMATDDDRMVRKTLASFFQQLMSLCDPSAVKPFLPLLVTYICQALTHLNEQVRMDTLLLVNILVSRVGDCSKNPCLQQILPSMLGLFISSQNTSSSSSTAQQLCTVQSRASILSCLDQLLAQCGPLPSQNIIGDSSELPWYHDGVSSQIRKHQGNLQSYRTFDHGLVSWSQECFSISEELVRQIIPELLACWTESLSSSIKTEDEITCMVKVLELLAALFGGLEPSDASNIIPSLLPNIQTFVLAKFPYDLSHSGSTCNQAMLNVAACKLVAFFLDEVAPDLEWTSVVFSFVTNSLLGVGDLDFCSLSHADVISLLSTLETFMKPTRSQMTESGLKAVLAQASRCHPLSITRRACLEFISEWLAHHEPEPLDAAMIMAWLQFLPKALWQLKADHIQTSRVILSILLVCGRYSARQSQEEEKECLFDAVHDSIIPFFYTVIESTKKHSKHLFGPFITLPGPVQRKALDILWYLSSPKRGLLRAIAACCTSREIQSDIAIYAVNIIHMIRTRIAAADYGSFMFTIIVAHNVQDVVQRHICRCLTNLRAGPELTDVFSPMLVEFLTYDSKPAANVTRGLVMCVAACARSAAQPQSTNLSQFMTEMHASIAELLVHALQVCQSPVNTPEMSQPDGDIIASIKVILSHCPTLWLAVITAFEQQSVISASGVAFLCHLVHRLDSHHAIFNRDDCFSKTVDLVNSLEKIGGTSPMMATNVAQLRVIVMASMGPDLCSRKL